MEKTRNIMRIRINLSIIGVCLIGALLAAKSGKKAAERGETLTKHNQQWHQEYNDSQNTKQSKAENWNSRYYYNIVPLAIYNVYSLYKQLDNKR